MLWKRKKNLNFPSNVTCIYWLENCYLVAACSFSSPHFECKSEGAFWINIIFLIMIDYNTTHNNKNASTFPNVAENHLYLFQEFQEESFFAKNLYLAVFLFHYLKGVDLATNCLEIKFIFSVYCVNPPQVTIVLCRPPLLLWSPNTGCLFSFTLTLSEQSFMSETKYPI